MTQLRLLCTDPLSFSAKKLAEELERMLGYKVYRSDKVIPNRQHIRYGDQRDKLTQYKYFRNNGLNFPWFTESKGEAANRMMGMGGMPIVCRTLLQGQEGHGIVIANDEEELVDAPVYVEYQEKTTEYRVNIFHDKIVNIREKRKKRGFVALEGHEPRIRNVANGYVFCIVPTADVPHEILNTALEASYITDSNIIGVDIAYNANTGRHFLLEVNSAPALEGITVEHFAQAIIERFE